MKRYFKYVYFSDFSRQARGHRVGAGESVGVRRRRGRPRRRRCGVGHAAQGGDQAVARAAGGSGDGERVHERQTEPAAVGGGAPAGRDRDANLRRLVG